MSDDRIFLTPEQAETMLPEGDTVHCYRNPNGMLIGADWDRADVIKAFATAREIEIGGQGCRAVRHPLVVTQTDNRAMFFEADMDKVEAFEAALPVPVREGV